MKTSLLIIAIVTLLFIVQPVYAGEAEDSILNEIAQWTTIANLDQYNILGIYICEIGTDPLVSTLDLGPGKYHLYMSGDMRIQDIDATLYESGGEAIVGDTLPDKEPILVFRLRERASVNLEIDPFAFTEGDDTGYVCVLVVSEEGGEVFDFTGTLTDKVEPPPIRNFADVDMDVVYNEEIGFRLDGINNRMTDRSYENLQSQVFEPGTDVNTLNMELEPGFYMAYVISDSRCDTLSLTVSTSDGTPLGQAASGNCIATSIFGIPVSENVQFNVGTGFSENNPDLQAYSACLVSYMCGLDVESRKALLDNLYQSQVATYESDENYIVVMEHGVDVIGRNDTATYEYDLGPGIYSFEGVGDQAVSDLNINAFDADGNPIYEDTQAYRSSRAEVELTEPTHVSFEVSIGSTMVDVEEASFYYILYEHVPPPAEEE
ncbi:MAG: hypothetical protein NTY09_09850 [bacterium]|nr:hypothetical protein [bacterium]